MTGWTSKPSEGEFGIQLDEYIRGLYYKNVVQYGSWSHQWSYNLSEYYDHDVRLDPSNAANLRRSNDA